MKASTTPLFAGVLLLVAGCASRDVIEPGDNGGEFAAALQGAEYVSSEDCISSLQYDHVEVLSDDRLLFTDDRGTYWVNEMRTRCVGLDTYDALKFEKRSASFICDLDTVAALNSIGFGWQEHAQCTLGEFKRLDPVASERLNAVTGD